MARKILVVEDDHNISDLIRMYLEKEGFEVQAVFDGGSAVDMFRSMEPDMVLLDIMLPVMDGWAVCAKIRETTCYEASSAGGGKNTALLEEACEIWKNLSAKYPDNTRFQSCLELALEELENRKGTGM